MLSFWDRPLPDQPLPTDRMWHLRLWLNYVSVVFTYVHAAPGVGDLADLNLKLRTCATGCARRTRSDILVNVKGRLLQVVNC
jgi:hypothetical protein